MPNAPSTWANPFPVESGVHDIPIRLEAALEAQRDSFHGILLAAQRRLSEFAIKHNWNEYIKEPLAQSAHFYAEKAAFDHDLLEISGLDPTLELPETYCAALEQGVLMSVSPELYRKLYIEGDEEDAFEKLLIYFERIQSNGTTSYQRLGANSSPCGKSLQHHS